MWWLLWACSGPAPVAPIAATWCDAQGQALGTTWTLRWQAEGCDAEVEQTVARVLAEVDAHMSTWRDDSELARVRAGGQQPVSWDTQHVVREALVLAERTRGAFDPTVQPLMEVWGFHSKERHIAEPSPEALQQARDAVGWSKVQLGVEPSPWIDAHGTALDLSAIAKGHAVDRVFHAVTALGPTSLMVEVGGEVRVGGAGPRGSWALGVDAPKEGTLPGTELAAVLYLQNAALATSGNYRNLVEVGGQRVHHTMDPRTGRPAVSDVASASVVAPSCLEADGLATAVMVLGAEAGLALIEATPDTEAVVLVASEQGWTQRTSSGAARLLR